MWTILVNISHYYVDHSSITQHVCRSLYLRYMFILSGRGMKQYVLYIGFNTLPTLPQLHFLYGNN